MGETGNQPCKKKMCRCWLWCQYDKVSEFCFSKWGRSSPKNVRMQIWALAWVRWSRWQFLTRTFGKSRAPVDLALAPAQQRHVASSCSIPSPHEPTAQVLRAWQEQKRGHWRLSRAHRMRHSTATWSTAAFVGLTHTFLYRSTFSSEHRVLMGCHLSPCGYGLAKRDGPYFKIFVGPLVPRLLAIAIPCRATPKRRRTVTSNVRSTTTPGALITCVLGLCGTLRGTSQTNKKSLLLLALVSTWKCRFPCQKRWLFQKHPCGHWVKLIRHPALYY